MSKLENRKAAASNYQDDIVLPLGCEHDLEASVVDESSGDDGSAAEDIFLAVAKVGHDLIVLCCY